MKNGGKGHFTGATEQTLPGFAKIGMAGGKCFPFIQRDLLVSQCPSLKKRFLYARDYSNATVDLIFPKKDLDAGQNLRAETLETCWFENNGGLFILRQLPNEAQISPANGIAVADFTGDGKPDILLAGNKHGFDSETNRCDSGNGTLLSGDGRGNFSFVGNPRSGFWAGGEVRDIVLVKGAGGRRQVIVANNSGATKVFGVLR